LFFDIKSIKVVNRLRRPRFRSVVYAAFRERMGKVMRDRVATAVGVNAIGADGADGRER
jgi:hypothetical protein